MKINNRTLPALAACIAITSMMHNAAASDAEIWKALKAGGKVVLMRHAQVERGPGSGNPLLRDPSCEKEKKLSPEGRRHAELAGRRFREQGIRVDGVMHSPYCRTSATAQLAFGKASPAQVLSLLEVLSPAEASRQTERLNQLIEAHAGDGNLILVTHEPNINAVSFELMKHLDMLVIDPNGEDAYEEVGVIRFSTPD